MSVMFLMHWVSTRVTPECLSVEDVPAIVNIKTLKGRLISHKFNTGWTVGVSKTLVERLRGGQALGTSYCCKRVNTVEKQYTQLRSLDQFTRLRFEINRL